MEQRTGSQLGKEYVISQLRHFLPAAAVKSSLQFFQILRTLRNASTILAWFQRRPQSLVVL